MHARELTFRFVLICAVGLGLSGSRSLAETSPPASPAIPSPLNPDIGILIQQLGSPSFRARAAASEKLRTSTTDRLRPALLEAARHAADPEVRQRAAKLLCDLAWSSPQDPPAVQRTLDDYRTPDPEKRIEVVGRLAAVRPGSLPALLRLLEEEPSEDVRWAIVTAIRMADGGETARQRELKPAVDDAPSWAVVGWAWQQSDPERAAPLLRRAADIATTQPVDDHGEVDAILQVLMTRAINRAEYADAVELYRRQMWYGDLPPDQAVQNLFALHAQYGAQPGFERDVRTFAAFFAQPEMMYVLGRLHAHDGSPLAAEACYAAAAAASVGDADAHLRVGEFLFNRQWFDLARVELRRAIGAKGDNAAGRDARAYGDLSRCADGLGNEPQAAIDLDEAQKALRAMPANPNLDLVVRQFGSLADWHRLRDAAQRDDRAQMARMADRLLANAAWRADQVAAVAGWRLDDLPTVDVAIDLTRALKSLGRNDDAERVFGEAYPTMQKALAQQPHDAEALNNLAWLCARSGEHTAEAYGWATEAIRLAPGNAAYLDTAAEAAAAVGKWDEAVERETTALQLQPADRFMTKQLERFKAGKQGR